MEPQASTGTSWLSRLFWGAIALTGIGFLCVLLTPQFAYSPCGKSSVTKCRYNLRQLGEGLIMYCQDYDERFPPFREWNQRIYTYIKEQKCFYCPDASTESVKNYYAAFAPLELQSLTQILEPGNTPLLYDSVRTKPSPYDQLLSLPEPERHSGGNYIAYVDGSVRGTSNRLVRGQGLRAFQHLKGETPE